MTVIPEAPLIFGVPESILVEKMYDIPLGYERYFQERVGDPNSHGLPEEDLIKLMSDYFHDGEIEKVSFDSSTATISFGIQSYTLKAVFYCRVSFVGVTAADIDLDGSEIYSVDVVRQNDESYQLEMFTAFSTSRFDFKKFLLSEWEEYDERRPIQGIKLKANFKFP